MAHQDDLTAEGRAAQVRDHLMRDLELRKAFSRRDVDAETKADWDREWDAIITRHIRQARKEALREAAKCIKQREQYYAKKEAESEGALRMTRGLQRNEASGCMDAINRLASEGA